MKKIFCIGALCGAALFTAAATTSIDVRTGEAPANGGVIS